MISMKVSLIIFVALPLSSCTSSRSGIARLLKQDQPLTVGFVNDLYHCLTADPSTDDSVNCDEVSLVWNTTLLKANKMPKRCVGFDPATHDPSQGDDYFEPCVHWKNIVDSISESPSATPSTLPTLTNQTKKPTQKPKRLPTLEPTPKQVSTSPSLSPSFSIANLPNRALSSFTLTLILPNRRKLRSLHRTLLSTTDELVKMTEQHMKSFFEESLSLTIASIDLTSISAEYTTSYLMQDLQGQIYFYPDSVIPTQSTLDFLVKQAFLGVALDRFLISLQDNAESSILRKVIYAELVIEEETVQSQPKEVSFFGDFQWTTPWIVICAAGGAAIVAVIVLIVLLCKARSNRAASWRDSLEKQNSGDTPTTHPEDLARFDDDDVQSDLHSDVESDATSVYSYKQQDDTSVSLAPSFLHAINERSALGEFYGAESDDDSLRSASLLWNHPEQQESHLLQNCPRPNSVTIRPFHRSAYKNPQDRGGDVASNCWTYESAQEVTGSIAGDESVAGGSAIYLTDDDELPEREFASIWDDESKKVDLTTFPVGDVSLEESDYSYT